MSVTFYPNYIHNVGFDAAQEPSVAGQGGTRSDGTAFDPGDGGMWEMVDSNRDVLLTVDTNGEATDFSIDFDLAADITDCDFSILDNANIQTALADMRLTYNGGGTELISPTYYGAILGNASAVLTVSSNWVLADEGSGDDDVFLVIFTAATDNNWEWNFRDFEASNFAADCTFGEIVIGKKLTAAYMPEIGIIKSSDFGTGILQSKGGHKYGFKNYGESRRWSLNWIFISDAEKANFETLWAVTEGMRYPFYIDLGEAATPQLYYVRFAMPELQFTEVPGAWKLNIIIEEEV